MGDKTDIYEHNRQAKYYKLTHACRKQLVKGAREWEQTSAIPARGFTPTKES